MKEVVKYQANDGTLFNDRAECVSRDELIEIVDMIMCQLPDRPDDTSFSNGGGFILHDMSRTKLVRMQLLLEIKKHITHNWVDQTIENDGAHPSAVAGLLDDYNIKPLRDAWFRFLCIDKEGREWGQPYYATNPSDAKQIQLN